MWCSTGALSENESVGLRLQEDITAWLFAQTVFALLCHLCFVINQRDDSNWSLLLLEAENIYSDIYSRVLLSTRPYQALNQSISNCTNGCEVHSEPFRKLTRLQMLNGEQNKLVEGSAELRGARIECKHAEKLKTSLIRLSLKQTAAAAEDRCVASLPKD